MNDEYRETSEGARAQATLCWLRGMQGRTASSPDLGAVAMARMGRTRLVAASLVRAVSSCFLHALRSAPAVTAPVPARSFDMGATSTTPLAGASHDGYSPCPMPWNRRAPCGAQPD
jgi:hypothetical protein